mgnify:CR=1 FL=1
MRKRLSIFKSNKYIYAQIIDDEKRQTLAAAMGKDPAKVGSDLASLASKKKIKKVTFDRGRFKYHGQVKILAEAARKGGLEF